MRLYIHYGTIDDCLSGGSEKNKSGSLVTRFIQTSQQDHRRHYCDCFVKTSTGGLKSKHNLCNIYG